MHSYRVLPIPAALADAARATMASPQYGHPAHAEIASGYGPCRACLATFAEGREQRLLFTYNPFEGLDPYPSPGPIFIHRERCAPYAVEGFPPQLRGLPLMLEAYAADRRLVAREPVGDCAPEPLVERLLADPAVAYIHVRNAEAGCFIAHIERV